MMPRIKLMNANGNLLYKGVLYRLPLREEKIISYGLTFYQTTKLCFSRREAVRRRIYMELEDKLNKNAENNAISLEELGELRKFVDF